MKAIHIDENVCKGCGLCVDCCKKNILVISDRRNGKGHFVPEINDPENCSGCLMCEINCPDLAIYVEETGG